jgi:hypothetical protein
MSESKPDCNSFSIINDDISDDKSKVVQGYTGVTEVSCVGRGKNFLCAMCSMMI